MRKNMIKALAGMVCLALLLSFVGGISPIKSNAASSWELQGELDKLTPDGKREAQEAEEAKREAEEKALEEAAQRARQLRLMRMKINF